MKPEDFAKLTKYDVTGVGVLIVEKDEQLFVGAPPLAGSTAAVTYIYTHTHTYTYTDTHTHTSSLVFRMPGASRTERAVFFCSFFYFIFFFRRRMPRASRTERAVTKTSAPRSKSSVTVTRGS